MGVEPKIGGKTPKMDGENKGKTLWTNGWFGGFSHYFWKHPYVEILKEQSLQSSVADCVPREIAMVKGSDESQERLEENM